MDTEAGEVGGLESGDSRLDNKRSEEVSDVQNGLLTVAVLIATATYQAMLSPPGGVWQDDKSDDPKHVAGVSILVTKKPVSFGWFMFGNTIGFFFVFVRHFVPCTCACSLLAVFNVAPNQYIGLRYKILSIVLAIFLPCILQLLRHPKPVLQLFKRPFHK